MSRRADRPEHVHEAWMGLWRMHACVEEPNWQMLHDLHRALSKREAEIYDHAPRQCIAALRERLELARRLGLELVMPEWATDAAKQLVQVTAEEA